MATAPSASPVAKGLQPAKRAFKPPKSTASHQDGDLARALELSKKEAVAKSLLSENEDREFQIVLEGLGLNIVAVEPDGHCLYRSVTMSGHAGTNDFRILRKRVADEMIYDADRYKALMAADPVHNDETADFATYVADVRRLVDPIKFGGDLELRALSNMLAARITILKSNGTCHHYIPEGISGNPLSFPLVRLTYHLHLFAAPHYQLLE